MSERDNETTGSFVTKTVTQPPIHIDCSNWVDTSKDEWTFGTFVVNKITLPPIHIDCSSWGREPTTWLEFTVAFQADADLAKVESATVDFIQAIQAMGPDLKLTYDASRTRVTDQGNVVVALVPQQPDAAQLKTVRDKVLKVLKVETCVLQGA